MENINDKCSREEEKTAAGNSTHCWWCGTSKECGALCSFFRCPPRHHHSRGTYVIALFSLAIKISETVCVFYNLNTSITIELLLKWRRRRKKFRKQREKKNKIEKRFKRLPQPKWKSCFCFSWFEWSTKHWEIERQQKDVMIYYNNGWKLRGKNRTGSSELLRDAMMNHQIHILQNGK